MTEAESTARDYAIEPLGVETYNGTRSLFEPAGFRCDRPKGQKNCVMSLAVAPDRRPVGR